LLNLINEILDLAMVESGKLQLSLEPMSLGEVMLDCQTMIEPQAQKCGITVSFCQLEKPCFVLADRTRVKADPHQPSFQCNKIQSCVRSGRRGVLREFFGTHPHQRQRHRPGLSTDKLAQAVPAVQSSRSGGRRREGTASAW